MTVHGRHEAVSAGRHRGTDDDRRWSAHRGTTIQGVVPAAYLGELAARWRSMEIAPRDGTRILASIAGHLVAARWAEDRTCMLADVAAGAGTFGPGWVDLTNDLPVDEPEAWRPLPAAPVGDVR